jgi:hypothetical protein
MIAAVNNLRQDDDLEKHHLRSDFDAMRRTKVAGRPER